MRFIFNLFDKKQNNEIVSVQELTLKTVGMRVTHLYKTVCDEMNLRLEFYREVFIEGEVRYELEKSVFCTNGALIELMNNCNVMKWDGFHGKHPKNVLDGTMFAFTATVNESRLIRADGSENFPKGYREFVRRLDEMLSN